MSLTTACVEPSGPDALIVIVPGVDTLVLGSSAVFHAYVTRDGIASSEPIRWVTSDSTVATVRADGRAYALAPGVAGITASAEDVTSAPATLVVVPRPDPSVDLTPARVKVRVGSVVLLTARMVGGVQGSPDVSYTWTTSAPQVAVVFEVPSFPYALGVALRPGVAEIKAAAGDVVSAPSMFEVVGTAASPR